MTEAIESKTLLLGFINRVKTLEDERAELAADAADVCKEAKGAGYEPVRIREVVRWLRRIDKHGRFAVDEAEAIFDLYRHAADPSAKPLSAMMPDERDQALLRLFAPAGDAAGETMTRRMQSMRASVAMARAASQARSQ